jgi:D-serine deaminase-like pyridoxal phosphate-dependent protein
MHVRDLDTPALILDRSRLEANLARMSAKAKAQGVDLRPHMKTTKSADIARLATQGHSGAITVSTLKEAEYFFKEGFRNILYAVGITEKKLDRAAALVKQGADLTMVTDCPQAIDALSARALSLDCSFKLLIELDCGDGRAGIPAESSAVMELARAIDTAPNLTLSGVMTHGGHSYDCRNINELKAVAEVERKLTVQAAERLREAGHACSVVSIGSTPTAVHGESFEGATEIRPGVYMFQDLFQAEIGSCGSEDLALAVLATVIGHYPERGEAIIDAGGLALSKDRSLAATDHDLGYGHVVPIAGQSSGLTLQVLRVSQEHGVVGTSQGAFPYDLLKPGDHVLVYPNHACMTAAAYDGYHVVDGSEEAPDGDRQIQCYWPRVNGW